MTDLEIFHNAPENTTPKELAAYLDEACGDDGELRLRVEALFEKAKRTDDFLEQGPVADLDPGSAGTDLDATTIASNSRSSVVGTPQDGSRPAGIEAEGEHIGNYHLVEKIGEGGFGTVWRAEQSEPVQRQVAFKIIKAGRDTEEVIRRFEQERQALAVMDHPNIARVYDAGATPKGRPWFAMELVEGESITEYCDRRQLTVSERLELFVPVCRAVQHAHAKGIVHRDLKPSNVLVAEHDEQAAPRVIDFGIAKAIEELPGENALKTLEGMAIGTPVYMSPEQLNDAADVDTRTDVYSLGVLLYEMLTGVPPIDPKELKQAGYVEMERLICEVEPPKPSLRAETATKETAALRKSDSHRLGKRIRGDLDWIVMKALEKDRARRYDTVAGLATDIEHYLADEPVSAAAPSLGYQLKKLMRRHRGPLGAAAAMVFLIAVGGVISFLLAVRAKQAENQASLKEKIVAYRLAEARAPQDNPNIGLARLAGILREDPSNRTVAERLVSAMHSRDFSIPETLRFDGAYVRFSPDGKVMLSGFRGGTKTVRFRDADTGAEIGKPIELALHLIYAEFSPDGNFVVTSSGQNDINPSAVEVWDWRTGKRVVGPLMHDFACQFAGFSPDGTRLLAAYDNRMARIWDIRRENVDVTGQPVSDPVILLARGPVVSAQWGPGGRRVGLATLGENSAGQIRDANTGELLVEGIHESTVWSVRFNHDGSRFVTASADRTARIWDTATGAPVGNPLRHLDRVQYAEFSPDGSMVVTASWDGTARVWDAETGLAVTIPLDLGGRLNAAHFDASGMRVIAGSENGQAAVWNAHTGKAIGARFYEDGPIVTARFHPDAERSRVVVGARSFAQLWRIQPGRARGLVFRHEKSEGWTTVGRDVTSADFSPDGMRLATGAVGLWAYLWDVNTGTQIGRISSMGPSKHVRFSADGQRLLAASQKAGVSLWSVPASERSSHFAAQLGAARASSPFELLATPAVQKTYVLQAEFGPGERSNWIAGAGIVPPQTWLWQYEGGSTLEESTTMYPDNGEAPPYTMWVSWDPDGSRLATVNFDGRVRIWEIPAGKLQATLQVRALQAEFNAAGTRLVTAGGDGNATIWNVSEDFTGEDRRLQKLPHIHKVWWAEFSPDGRRVATASVDKTARIWDVDSGRQIGIEMRHESSVVSARFSPDGGRRVATGAEDGSVRIWDAETGFPLSDAHRHDDKVLTVAWSADGNKVVSTATDATARIWAAVPAPAGEVPGWLPDWIEAAVGVRVLKGDELRAVGWEEWNGLREMIEAMPEDDYYTRVARWFYAAHEDRPVSPFTGMTLDAYVGSCLSQATLEGYEEAVRIAPADPVALGRLAVELSEQSAAGDPVATLRANSYSKRAVELCEVMLESDPHDLSALSLLVELDGSEDIAALDRLTRIFEDRELVDAEIATRRLLADLADIRQGEGSDEALALREQLALRLKKMKRHQESLEEWLEILERLPEDTSLGRLAELHRIVATRFQLLDDHAAAGTHHTLAMKFQRQWIDRLRPQPEIRKLLLALNSLGRWAVAFQEWAVAETAFQEIIDITIENDLPALHAEAVTLMAGLFLKMGGREDDYRLLCDHAMKNFEESTNQAILQWTTRVCCAVPPGYHVESSIRMAGRCPGPLGSLALGMAQYRAGRYTEAATALEIAKNGLRGKEGKLMKHCLAKTLVYQAMTAQRLGKAELADAGLAEAEKVFEPLFDQFMWHERAMIRAALSEARELILDK